MWISTFHSACVRILRRQAEVMGMKSGFTIYDSADSRALIKRIVKDLDADTLNLTPGIVAGKISKQKNELVDVDSLRPQHQHRRPGRGRVPRDLPSVHRRVCAGRTRSTSTT